MKIKWRLGFAEQAQFELYTMILARLLLRYTYKQCNLALCLCAHKVCVFVCVSVRLCVVAGTETHYLSTSVSSNHVEDLLIFQYSVSNVFVYVCDVFHSPNRPFLPFRMRPVAKTTTDRRSS